MSDWQPKAYLAFAEQRARPARDLLAEVPLESPGLVHDLGCGPGNSTSLLVARFPNARVTGIDKSPAMLEAARKVCPQAEFRLADLAAWQPDDEPGLLFSNAAFQWVPRHLDILERLAGGLKQGAALAVQMPDNLDEPSHLLMDQVAKAGPWAAKFEAAGTARQPLPPVSVYYQRLKPHLARVEIWRTTYNHALDGVAGIAEFFSSTGLRPYLDPLDADEKTAFLSAYTSRLAAAYPSMADGKVLLQFPRLFFVGLR